MRTPLNSLTNSIKVSLLYVSQECPKNRGAPQSLSVCFGKVMNFQEGFVCFFEMAQSSYGMLEKMVSITM